MVEGTVSNFQDDSLEWIGLGKDDPFPAMRIKRLTEEFNEAIALDEVDAIVLGRNNASKEGDLTFLLPLSN